MTTTNEQPSGLAFIDTETTGLDPDEHQIWEVACITEVAGEMTEYLWHLPVDLGRADAVALKIGGFHERYGNEPTQDVPYTHRNRFAEEFATLTRGKHLVGAVVSFDEERLRHLLRSNGACPEWHYHLIDVEAMMVGWLAAQRDFKRLSGWDQAPTLLPWKSDDLSRAVGVDPEAAGFAKHTALGDARWVKAIYEKIMGSS